MPLSALALPLTSGAFAAKRSANLPAFPLLVEEFGMWHPLIDGATVTIYKAGTTQLADIYFDHALTLRAPNPQVLLTKTDALGVRYGRFAVPLYTPQAYSTQVSTGEETGIIRPPLIVLAGEDASRALVQAAGSARPRMLLDRAADVIQLADFGALGDSPTINTATLVAAIGRAAALGGASVHLPAAVIPFTSLTLPAGVVLVGRGRNATNLTSTVAAPIIILGGNDSGLADLTLDGLDVVTGSVGVAGTAITSARLERVTITRLETGLRMVGGLDHNYEDLRLSACGVGAELRGDAGDTVGGGGSEFAGLRWANGLISTCTVAALRFLVVDLGVRHNQLSKVGFVDNLGSEGLKCTGARHIHLEECWWDNNTTNLVLADLLNPYVADRELIDVRLEGGEMTRGVVVIDGQARDVVFERIEFDDVEMQANVPDNQVTLLDCDQNKLTLIGDASRIGIQFSSASVQQKAITTDATPLTVWKYRPGPGSRAVMTIWASAEQLNGTNGAVYMRSQGVKAAVATLFIDEESPSLVVGDLLTGLSGGATARLVAKSGAQLSLSNVAGNFLDNELIEASGGGLARANGTMSTGSVSLLGTIVDHLTVEDVSSWDIAFVASGGEVVVQVTGAASSTIQWLVRVDVTGP